ncbi:MAG: FkbM family methyltransferase [Flavobacteriales bacterium]|nr:FkbM family methyltransferase [Flavobacteriales bacterium]
MEHLLFRGPFTIEAAPGRRFRMVNHGHQLETLIFWTGLYALWEPKTMQAWAKACEGRRAIIDVGANTGLFALVAKCITPSAKVHCFEPLPRIRERLEANVALNGYDIQVHASALSVHAGKATLFQDIGDHGYLASLEPGYAGEAGTCEVAVERMDDVLEQAAITRVDLLKIDVERHEPAVLKGMGRYLVDRPTIFIEVLNDAVARGIIDAIDGLGYSYFQVDEQEGMKRMPGITAMDEKGGHGYNYILCTEAEAARIGLPAT